MAKKTVLRRAEEVVSRKNPDGSVSIMHFENEKFFFSVTGVAAEFWGMLDGKRPLADIQARLAKKHRVSEKKIAEPVLKLVRSLVNAKLVVRG